MLHTSITACGKFFSLNFLIADITITITWLLSVLYFRYHLFLDTLLLHQRVSLVEQELLTIAKHMSSLPVFSGFVLFIL